MPEPYTVLAITLPETFFPDGDDSCRFAGSHIARELSALLQIHGHTIPPWMKGGCQEDSWVYLESERLGVQYAYTIVFFPRGNDNRSMAIQYAISVGWLKRLIGKQPKMSIDDPIHDVLREFGTRFENSEFLTESEFASEY